MTRHWNNKGRITLCLLFFALCSTLYAICFILPERADSGPYLDSAHGNSAYGVDRTSLSAFGYSKGNCVHCHEQHASIGGSEPAPTANDPSKFCLLADNFSGVTTKPYVQSDNVCFSCHISTGTFQSPPFSNYSYSITFGGSSDSTPNNIQDAFNGLSYHNLYDTYRFITGLSGSHPNFTNFPSDSNPCSGCHNIHIAQRSSGKPSGSFDATKSAISKPGVHNNLWGSSIGQKMSDYAPLYQPPYYNVINLEPDGATSDRSTQAAKTPDYVTFCTDCHNNLNTIYSSVLGRNLYTFDWGAEKHGKGVAADNGAFNEIIAPYQDTQLGSYVLACTDCHEPHGSSNNFLVRTRVNNGTVTVTSNGAGSFGKEWLFFCDNCHDNLNGGVHVHPTDAGCLTCHPGGDYKVCTDCHYHGNLF